MKRILRYLLLLASVQAAYAGTYTIYPGQSVVVNETLVNNYTPDDRHIILEFWLQEWTVTPSRAGTVTRRNLPYPNASYRFTPSAGYTGSVRISAMWKIKVNKLNYPRGSSTKNYYERFTSTINVVARP